MKNIYVFFLALLVAGTLSAQEKVDSIKFFTDEEIVEMTLTTDIRKMQQEKGEDMFQPATALCKIPGMADIEEQVQVAPRGHFRRQYCAIPPIMIDFSNPGSPKLSPLGKLKLVIGCGSNGNDEQLVLKEYLIYKIYNQLEDKSFRVRLLKVNYVDTRGKVKPFTQYAFLIEDDKDMAVRNNCERKPKATYAMESTNRELMTKVAVFEYMISNGDWSVPANHNIRLIHHKENQYDLPYAVPYDFDHSGFVNASYATPAEILGTESVTERVYRGFPRTMEELQNTFDLFRAKRNAISSLISNFSLLNARNKKELVSYIDEFYKIIEDNKRVKTIFIDNARTR